MTDVTPWLDLPARPVNYNQAVGGFVLLMGFSLKETTGTAIAELDLYNGTDTSGLDVYPITLAAGQSTADNFAPGGLLFPSGLFPSVVSGSVKGSLWIKDRFSRV